MSTAFKNGMHEPISPMADLSRFWVELAPEKHPYLKHLGFLQPGSVLPRELAGSVSALAYSAELLANT